MSASRPVFVEVPPSPAQLTRIDFTPPRHACSVCGGEHRTADPRGVPIANYPHPNRAQRRGRR